MIRRLTFSKAALAERCAYWLRPEVRWTESDNAAAGGGRTVHGALAALVPNIDGPGAPPAEAELRGMYASGKAWLRERHVLGMRAEVAFAYDVAADTGRELEDPAGAGARWYAEPAHRAAYAGPGGPIRDTEVCGRVDLVCMGVDEHGGFVRLWDYKCHFGPEFADARAQLGLCALAVARAWDVERVQAIGVHLWADMDAEEERHELTAFDLDQIAASLHDLASAPPDAPATEGPWCRARYCDARAVCPKAAEATSTALEVIPPARLARGHSLGKPITSPEEGAWTLVAINLVEEVLAAKKLELKAFADAVEGIPLADGNVYAGQMRNVERPDLGIVGAVEVLEELGLDFAIAQTTSWEAIKEAYSAAKAKEAREALRKIGALKTSSGPVYAARAPKTAARKAS